MPHKFFVYLIDFCSIFPLQEVQTISSEFWIPNRTSGREQSDHSESRLELELEIKKSIQKTQLRMHPIFSGNIFANFMIDSIFEMAAMPFVRQPHRLVHRGRYHVTYKKYAI